MQISKDMLIGELLQKSDLIAPILMRAGSIAWAARLLRESLWKRHAWFTALTVTHW